MPIAYSQKTFSIAALKKILFLSCALLISLSTQLTAQNIPDANFAAAIRAVCPTCINGSNNLTAAAASLTSLNIGDKSISDLSGIGGFTSLTFLSCYNNQLTTLPTLPSSLSYLACYRNQLTSLPTLPSSLTSLYCDDNQLTSLPTLPSSLRTLYCYGNNISCLPTLPNSLRDLVLDADKIACLPNSVVGLSVFNATFVAVTLPTCAPPSVSISPTSICVGESPTLTATAVNGGSSPQFYWTKNNKALGISAFSNIPNPPGALGIRDVYVSSGGTLYMATNGAGLGISTDGGATFSYKTSAANGLGDNITYGVYVGNDGTIYVATNSGLSISRDGGATFSNKTQSANGLGNNLVFDVYVGSDRTIYAGTLSGGLSISINGGTTFSNKTTANGLGSNLVNSVYVGSDGTIYASTNGGLSISRDGGTTFSNKTTANGLGNNIVNSVYVGSDGTIYASTQGGLSISTDGGMSFSNKTQSANGLGGNIVLRGNVVNSVYVGSDGTIYAATFNGLSISRDGGASFINKPPGTGVGGSLDNADNVISVYVGSDGKIYAVGGGGLYIASQATVNSLAVTSAVAGDVYKVTLVPSADVCPSPATATASVSVSTSLLSLSTPNVGFILCQNGSTTISAVASGGSGAYQYSLNGGAFQTNPVFTVQAGSYTITAKDGGGCTGTTALISVRDGSFALQCPSTTTVDAAQMGANGTVPTSASGNVNIISQCLTPSSTAVTDQVFEVNCGVVSPQTTAFFPQNSLADAQKVLIRTFSAVGGISTFSCYQTIYVRQYKMEDIVFPNNVTLTCPNIRTEPTEAGIGAPSVGNITLNATAQKGFTATYTDVRTTTPTGFTIQRTWTVNRCGGGIGNTRTFVQTITVPTCTAPSIAGSIGRENGTAVPATTLLFNSLTGKTDSTTGVSYSFANILTNSNIRVKPTRPNTDWTSGVTMLDVSLLSRHVLDINPLTSPYSIIGADVNADGGVDATDMLLIQRLILRLIPALPNNNSWRFVVKSHVFRNPTNPLASDFPEILVVPNLTSSLANGNFVAIKVGDLNQSAGAVNIRGGAKAFMLNTEDIVLEQGKTYQIPILMTSRGGVKNVGEVTNLPDVSAVQFTLNVDKTAAKINNIESGNLPNFTDNNTGLFQKEGMITAAWYRKNDQSLNETDNFTMMTVSLTPTKTTRLSEIMTINSAYTEGVAYDAHGTGLPVQLAFGNKVTSNEKAVLLPNRPNPFSYETTLSFTLPEAGKAKLTVCDLLGKVVMSSERAFAKGLNEVVFDASSTPSVSGGVFVVRLQTATGVVEQKIVLQR